MEITICQEYGVFPSLNILKQPRLQKPPPSHSRMGWRSNNVGTLVVISLVMQRRSKFSSESLGVQLVPGGTDGLDGLARLVHCEDGLKMFILLAKSESKRQKVTIIQLLRSGYMERHVWNLELSSMFLRQSGHCCITCKNSTTSQVSKTAAVLYCSLMEMSMKLWGRRPVKRRNLANCSHTCSLTNSVTRQPIESDGLGNISVCLILSERARSMGRRPRLLRISGSARACSRKSARSTRSFTAQNPRAVALVLLKTLTGSPVWPPLQSWTPRAANSNAR